MNDAHIDKGAIPLAEAGVAADLIGRRLPLGRPLAATDGQMVDLAGLAGRAVVYVHPMVRRPGAASPPGWELAAGARGCTAQSCAFRDSFPELSVLGVAHVFGLSVQWTADQKAAVEQLRLPFPLLSDATWEWSKALGLPSFHVGTLKVLQRLTLVVRDGRIEHVFYPVPVPKDNASEVIAWLRKHPL